MIPCLLLSGGGLVKTTRFAEPRYVGDPINTVRIFNDKQADELAVLDIDASRTGRPPDEAAIVEIASEAFMPVAYGGGVVDLATATRLIQLGVEKVIVNTAALVRPEIIPEIADRLGSSTLVAAIDVAGSGDAGYEVRTHGGTRGWPVDAQEHARALEQRGAGELLVTSIDRDGTMTGYDLELVRTVSEAVSIPVIACGGAATPDDLVAAVRVGRASAVAAGSMFVFHGRHRAVLITYPSYEARSALFAPA